MVGSGSPRAPLSNDGQANENPLAWLVACFWVGLAVVLPVWWLFNTHRLPLPYAVGFWALYGLWVLYSFISGSPNPATLVDGADSRPSTSKLQWLLWTIVTLFAYTVVAVASLRTSGILPQKIPSSLITAMGLSFGTMTAAKGVVVAYLATGKITKTDAADPEVKKGAKGLAALLQDDDGDPDLSKAQMLAWTMLAILFFLWQLVQNLGSAKLEMPDIDPTLVVLMGLGQGAYLGKKLVTTDTPRLTGVTPSTAGQNAIAKGTVEMTLTGMAFGGQQAGSSITINGMPIQAIPKNWEDTKITFNLPSTWPNGGEWNVGDKAAISVTVGGRDAVNSLSFAVIKSAT